MIESDPQLRVSACLNKPVKQSELLHTIAAVLAHTGPEAPRERKRTKPALSQLRILVAEDNAVNRELMVHLLSRRGYTVKVVANGKAALDALDKGSFDLVLMDIQMPVMGGLEVTAVIRERERTVGGHLPIIATTAHAMASDRERALKSGMDAYLAKPIQSRQLYETIGRVTGTGGIVDGQALLEGLGGDRRLLVKLIDLFLADYPRTLARIRRAIQVRQKESLRQAAHALKGSIGNFGPNRAYDAARQLELKGKAGSLRGAEGAFIELKKEMSRLRQSLRELRNRVSSGSQTLGIRS